MSWKGEGVTYELLSSMIEKEEMVSLLGKS